MPDPILLLEAAARAAAVAALVVLLTTRVWPAAASAGGAVGMGAGFLAGVWVLGVTVHYPPQEDQDRFLLVLMPAAVWAEIGAGLLGRMAWIPRAVVAAGTAPVLLYGSIYLTDAAGPGTREWPPARAGLIFGGLGLAVFAAWTSLIRLTRRVPGGAVPLGLSLTAAGAGATIMLSGYASGGQFVLPLAGGLFGVGVVAAFLARINARGAVGVGVVGLAAGLITGRFFAALTTTSAVLLFAAPLLAWGPELPPARRLGPRARGGLRVALVAVLVAVVGARAVVKFTADSARPADTPSNAHEPTVQDYLGYGH